MYDDLNDEQLLELNQQLERAAIQKQQRVFEKTPSRKTRTSSNLVQYEFDDSDDEKYADDPVAWALASRTGTEVLVSLVLKIQVLFSGFPSLKLGVTSALTVTFNPSMHSVENWPNVLRKSCGENILNTLNIV